MGTDSSDPNDELDQSPGGATKVVELFETAVTSGLCPPSFIRRHSRYKDVQELYQALPRDTKAKKTYDSITGEEVDGFIRGSSLSRVGCFGEYRNTRRGKIQETRRE